MSYSSHVEPIINEATLYRYDSNIDPYAIRKTVKSDLTEIVIDKINYYPQGCLGTDTDPSTRPCGTTTYHDPVNTGCGSLVLEIETLDSDSVLIDSLILSDQVAIL